MELLATVGFAIGFFVLIMASVALHEIGHMVPAKLFGVRVPQYFVGFGPRIWSTVRGDTEYGLKWFPLGGYVQLLGMYPPRPDGSFRRTRLSEFADDARAYEWTQISEEDVANQRLFYQKKTWQKLIVMAGGPAMNLLIAFVLMFGVTAGYGVYRPQTTISYVQPCVIADPTRTTCLPSDPPSPAAAAGLKVGDQIVEFNGVTISSYAQLSSLIRSNLDGPAQLVVERDGQRVTLTPVHTIVTSVADQLDPSRKVQAGLMGIRPTQVLTKGGPVEVLSDMWTLTQQSVVALVQFPVKVWHVVAGLVTGQPRDISDPISILGASQVAGQVVASGELDTGAKVASFASLLASVNLFLALFNFVPLPPLDGGHIAGALYEGARRGLAKLFRRRDPGYFDTAKLLPIAYGVGGLLLISGVALILADLISPVRLF
ncbi:membrane-associated protease RseP (regulator of RpoE activity) [Propionicimonas paludicola]|uniref:Membrane-associated protease RseP (Regulator of RpoE activity) n=1 Tax=Propionicimonas paludicola TaxID=185243 RepID=A0A2A9CS06_9ACTN|nr:site-2 protease family protein [Propionicimonas paludicola]PFG16400.1 membrane-associated protease RseP (regulator of RpoE activity) [Propionicimonas paludicola]